jgi:hypothetical protein
MRSRPLALAFLIALGGCNGGLELGTDDAGEADARASSSGDASACTGHVASSSSAGCEGACDGSGVPAVDGGDAPVTPAACKTACASAAAVGCNVDDTTASDACEQLCVAAPTRSQLDCVSASPCAALVHALEWGTALCGLDTADAGAPATCQSICSYVNDSCGATIVDDNGDAGGGAHDCESLCATAATTAELDCLAMTPCQTFAETFVTNGSLCGLPKKP